MTITDRNVVGPYDVDTALRLLSPADFGDQTPNGCLDYLVLIVKNIFVNLLRVLNYICGDHQWYDNCTACQIVEQYDPSQQADPILHQRVMNLRQALEWRANGNVSYAHGLHRVVQEIVSDLPTQSSMLLPATASTPQPTLAQLFSLSLKNTLLELTFEKMLNVADEMESSREKIEALSTIVERRAATNPQQANELFQQALDIVNPIEGGSDKSHILCDLAVKRFLTNPEQANELFQQAIENTLLGSDEHNKWKDLSLIAMARAPTNTEHALVVASLIQDHFRKDYAYEAIIIAKQNALSNPELAKEVLQKAIAIVQENEFDHCKAFCHIAETQALICPENALQTVDRVHNKFLKAETLVNIAKVLSSTNCEHANEILQQVIEDLSQENKTCYNYDRVICKTVKVQSAINLRQALQTVNLIQDNHRKANALCHIAKEQVLADPELVNELLQQAIELAKHLGHPMLRLSRNNVLLNIARTQALTDPEQALITADLLSDHFGKREALCEVAKQQALTDIEKALQTVNFIQESSAKAEAFCEIAKIQALTDHERAGEIFRQAIDTASLIHSLDSLDKIFLAITAL